MKIRILKSSFGFEKGKIYKAELADKGYFAENQHLSKFIPFSEAEEV